MANIPGSDLNLSEPDPVDVLDIAFPGKATLSTSLGVFINGRFSAALDSGSSHQFVLPASAEEIHLVSRRYSIPTISILTLLICSIYGLPVALLFIHFSKKSSHPGGTLNFASRLLAVEVPIADLSSRQIGVLQSRWVGKSVRLAGLDTISADAESGLPGPAFVRIIGREERVVESFPVELAEGTSFRRDETIEIKKGFELAERTESANLEMDVFILTAAVKKHYGEDRVTREEESYSVTDSIALTSPDGGGKYTVDWVEIWAHGEVTDGQTVHGEFRFRESVGPRTTRIDTLD